MQTNDQSGFSAAELLISLFIAAAFIATGYQLYSAVIANGVESRDRTRASGIAYNKLRQYAPQARNPCAAFTATTPTPTIPTGSGLKSPSITISFTCPYGVGSSISKISVSVKYDTPQKEVIHALLVNN